MDPFGLVGTTVADRYRVETLVGEGGFAVVYRATHAALGQTVALKCLKVPPHFTAGARQAFLAKFEEEGRILSKLGGHPSIVGVRDLGVCRDTGGQEVPFLALEWLDGCSPRARSCLFPSGASCSPCAADSACATPPRVARVGLVSGRGGVGGRGLRGASRVECTRSEQTHRRRWRRAPRQGAQTSRHATRRNR
jgi:hypothetical protein